MFPGFASECYKLADHERRSYEDLLLKRAGQRQAPAPIISVADHATHVAIRHPQDAADHGAYAINILPPFFLAPPREAVLEHLSGVLEATEPLPAIIQYAPALTGAVLDAAAFASLARAHGNLSFVKVESIPPGRFIASLARQDPPLPSLVGYARVQMVDAVERGAVGVQPESSFVETYQAVWERLAVDPEGAFELHARLLPYLSYWMQNVELLIAVEKLISYRQGVIASAYFRPPGYGLDAVEVSGVDRFLGTFARYLPRWS